MKEIIALDARHSTNKLLYESLVFCESNHSTKIRYTILHNEKISLVDLNILTVSFKNSKYYQHSTDFTVEVKKIEAPLATQQIRSLYEPFIPS